MRRTAMTETVKKDNDRQPEVKIGEEEKERERLGWVEGRISYCRRHCLLDTRQGRERQVQGPPLSLADDYRKRE